MSETTTPAATTAATTETTTTTTTPPAATTSVPAAASDWTAGLSDEMRGYVQNKGFKDVGAALESYRSYEKLMGVPQDRLIKLPENLDTPEGRAIFEKLGRPKEAKDYSIELPETAGGKEIAEWLRGIADQGNFTQKQLDTFAKAWNDRSAQYVKSQTEAAQARQVEQEGALKRDWGSAFDRNVNVAKAGATSLGFSAEHVDALESVLGMEATMKMLYKLGAATGEAEFVGGKTPGVGLLAADQAKAEIKRLGEDSAFVSRYAKGDAEARRTMENLHKMAYPGDQSL